MRAPTSRTSNAMRRSRKSPRPCLIRRRAWCSILSSDSAPSGRSAKDARIVHDLYEHTIDVILQATVLGGYRALPEKDIFDVEYWDLEQAKVRKAGKPPVFPGEVALVTGAASGIGKACVQAFLARGRPSSALDVNPAVAGALSGARGLPGHHLRLDAPEAVEDALEAGVKAFGGIDMLVLNAGVFPAGRSIDALDGRGVEARQRHQRGCEPLAAARMLPATGARASPRPRGRDRFEERSRARSRRRRLLGIESRFDATRARRGAGVGARRYPRERDPSRTRCSIRASGPGRARLACAPTTA